MIWKTTRQTSKHCATVVSMGLGKKFVMKQGGYDWCAVLNDLPDLPMKELRI